MVMFRWAGHPAFLIYVLAVLKGWGGGATFFSALLQKVSKYVYNYNYHKNISIIYKNIFTFY